MSAAIFGAVVGAGTGDPSALAVIGIGALSGGAGELTNSVVSQAIDRGQIDCGQLVVDTGIGKEKYLMPGQTVTVVGRLRITDKPVKVEPYYWIGLLHEQVAVIQDRIEPTMIAVGF